MNHEADRHALMIYIGAVMLVGLVIVFGVAMA